MPPSLVIRAHRYSISILSLLVVLLPGTRAACAQTCIDDVTGRFPALLTGLSLGAHGGLDPEALTARASKLPGDPEEQVSAALGELVAYLEFEIKNHPAIAKPDELLREYEALRRAVARG